MTLSVLAFRRGFCYFNSVAVAARLLQQRLSVSKILIVDWVSGSSLRRSWGSPACLPQRAQAGEVCVFTSVSTRSWSCAVWKLPQRSKK